MQGSANDADSYASHWAEGAQGFGLFGVHPAVVGSPEMEQAIANKQVLGGQISVSDCELNNRTVRCVQTNDDPRWGIVYTRESDFTFNDEGQITGLTGINSNFNEIEDFRTAFGTWMATAHPEVLETYFVPGFYTLKDENWRNPEAIAELTQLIDEFIAQSDVYPLSP